MNQNEELETPESMLGDKPRRMPRKRFATVYDAVAGIVLFHALVNLAH